jgi:hypothetical protein
MVCAIFGEHNRNRRADFNTRIFDSGLVADFDSGNSGGGASAEWNLSLTVCGDERAANPGMASRWPKLCDGGVATRHTLQRALVVSEPIHDSCDSGRAAHLRSF